MLPSLQRLLSDLTAEPSGPRFRWRWVTVPLCVLAVLTLFARMTNFDLSAQEAIYRAGGETWVLGDHPFWKLLYTLGTIPTTLVVLTALVCFFLSWSKESLRRWRRVFLYLVLTGVVGPGIVTNAILKEYWGRPRPREVEGLGGHNPFEPVLTIDPVSAGKSFPCGHATMGFYFLCGFFLLRRHRKELADGILLGALVLGGFMGIARMLQGAHFFSDVAWAAAVCWFTAMGLFYALRLDRGLVSRGLPSTAMPLKVRLAAGVGGVAILAGVLLASPYREVRNFFPVNDYMKEGMINVRLRFVAGEVEIVPGDRFHLFGEAYGHGMPTSNISENYVETNDGEFPAIAYVERISGFLTEANQQLTVTLPWDRINRLRIENMGAKIRIRGPADDSVPKIQLAEGDGAVHFEPSGQRWRLRGGENATLVDAESLQKRDPDARLFIIEREFTGSLFVEGEVPPEKTE